MTRQLEMQPGETVSEFAKRMSDLVRAQMRSWVGTMVAVVAQPASIWTNITTMTGIAG